MFYCDECAKKQDWPSETGRLFAIRSSYGPCELCKKTTGCYDIPSKYLPIKKTLYEDMSPEYKCHCGRFRKDHINGQLCPRYI